MKTKFGGKAHAFCLEHASEGLTALAVPGPPVDVRVTWVGNAKTDHYWCGCGKRADFYVREIEDGDAVLTAEMLKAGIVPEPACQGDGVCTNPRCPTHGIEWQQSAGRPAEDGSQSAVRDVACAGTHNGKHRDACVACGLPSGGSQSL